MEERLPGASAHISQYQANQLGKPSGTISISDIYEQIRTDDKLRQLTQYLQRKHREGIADSFQSIPKTSYQSDKKKYLDAVTFSGIIDRSQKTPSFRHTGRINLDIDEGNSKEDLHTFRRLVMSGHFPYVEALGYSISGFINCHSWANMLIEIPEDFQADYDKLEEVHKRYHKAISHALSDITLVDLECTDRFQPDQTIIRLSTEELQLLGIKSGHRLSLLVGKSDDVKRIRYVTHDKSLVVREAFPVTFADLEKFERYQEQKQKVNDMERTALNIIASDLFDFCHQFAVKHGFQYVDGQKQLYLANFCIGANLVGIPEEEVRTYILDNIHPVEDSDFIRYPYKAYKDSFGRWRNTARIKQKTFLPMDVKADTFMTFNKYLEDSPDFPKLLDRLCELDRSLLIVPTGSGKTHTTISTLYDRIKAQFPDKVFIYLSPLRAITRQVGLKADLQVICEGEVSHRQAIFQDSICTIKSFVDWSDRLHLEGLLKDVILVCDEAHELITSSIYQQFGLLPFVFDQVFKVIGLTATPLTPLVSLLKFTPVRCERLSPPAVIIEEKQISKDQLDKTLLEYADHNKKAKTLYFYNSKDGIKEHAIVFKRKGLKADFFHADLKKKQAETYNKLITEGRLPEDVDHFFSTKLLGTGTSFTGLDRIVYVTHNRSKDFLEFVQSLARNREDVIHVTLIQVVPKSESDKKHRLYDFDISEYKRQFNRLQLTADHWNRFTAQTASDGIDPLKNTLSNELNELVKYNKLTGKYYVDGLQMLGRQYDRITTSIQADDLLHFCKGIPNVTIKNNSQEAVISEQDQQIIDQVEQEQREEAEADTEALKVLFAEKRNQVFRHMMKDKDTDLELKDKLKDHLPLRIEELEDADRELVDRRFSKVQYITRRYIRLLNDYKDRISPEAIIEYCFLSSYNWKRKLRQLYSLDNVERSEAGEDLLKASQQSAKGEDILAVTKAHLELIQVFRMLKGRDMKAGDLYDQLKDKDFFQVLNLNQKTWTEEVKMFFHLHRTRTNKERLIRIGDRIRLDDLLTGDILENVCLKKKAV